MPYYDNTGHRIHRPLRRRRTAPAPDTAATRYIRRTADRYPGFTPPEIYTEIRHGRRRHDIPKTVVRAALA